MSRKHNLQSLLELRRSKVLEETCMGKQVQEIAGAMNLSQSTIKRDLAYCQKKAESQLNQWISQKIVFEVEKCVNTLSILNRQVFEIFNNATDIKDKLYCCELLKDIAKEKLELLANKTCLREALVEEQKKVRKLENRSRSLGRAGRPVSRPEREPENEQQEQQSTQEPNESE